MTKSTPKTKFLSKKRDLLIFFVLLSALAVFSSYPFQKNSRISISGIQLHQNRTFVESKLKAEDYRAFQSSAWEEHWYKQGEPDIAVTYRDDGSIQSIKGGRAEIDGRDATYWSLEQIREQLGPPESGGQGRAIGEGSHGFFSYPKYRLLVQRSESNHFVLFESGHKS